MSTPVAAPAQPRRRIERPPARRALFYSHDVFGLGHIRRTLALAGELGRQQPGAALLALTGSFETHAWELPPNFDYIKLPAWNRNALYTGLPPHPAAGGFSEVTYLRDALIQEAADAFAPHVLIVDNAPAGLHRELINTLMSLRAASPPVEIVFIMADVLDAARAIQRDWQREDTYWLLEEFYDHILVFGMREVYDIVHEYQFTPSLAAKTTFCGYYRRADHLAPPQEIRDRLGIGTDPLIVFASGGGADARPLLMAFLAALRDPALAKLGAHAFAITGPLLDEGARASVEAFAAGIPRLTLAPFADDLLSYLNAADVVVGMCGYNTTVETLSLGKRLIAIPRLMPAEQLARATRFAELGLLTVLRPNTLTPTDLALAICRRLDDPPPPEILDFGGLQRAGALIAGALRE